MTDRAREAIFSSLGGIVAGASVLDLYAGSGAMGLEALSRGAADCTFVERDRRAVAAIDSNVDAVGLGGEVVTGDVTRFVTTTERSFDLAFVDPPYAIPLPSVLQILEHVEPLMSDGAAVVVHRRRGEDPPDEVGLLVLCDRRRYGDADIWRFTKEEQ